MQNAFGGGIILRPQSESSSSWQQLGAAPLIQTRSNNNNNPSECQHGGGVFDCTSSLLRLLEYNGDGTTMKVCLSACCDWSQAILASDMLDDARDELEAMSALA